MRAKGRWISVCVFGTALWGGSLQAQATPPVAAPVGAVAGAKPAILNVQATPALWKLTGAKGTVYLFGSVHVMKPDVHWETVKEQEAFKSSSTLYLEIADIGPEAQKAMQPLVMSMGMDTQHPLSTKITKEDNTALDAALKKMGLPGESAVESMQPWLVYLTLSLLPMVQAGYDPASGIDQALQKEAVAAGKPVKGFETAEAQIHVLADMPQTQQVALLHDAIEEIPTSTDKMNEMVADWEGGKVDRIAALENDDLKVKHPDVYQKMLVDRNVAIEKQIAAMLKDPATGTVFVAVGAAHLAGPDSLQKMLEKDGYTAARVE